MFRKFIQELLPKGEQKKIQQRLEKTLGHRFKNKNLILTAIVHRSMVTGPKNTPVEHNERLEFLGDSVLNTIVTNYLYHKYPNHSEGDLSKMKAIIVSTNALASCSRKLELGQFLQLGPSELKSGGRDRTSILADVFEAVMGALYLDRGFKPCEKLIDQVLIPQVEELLNQDDLQNYKSTLLEETQKLKLGQPEYVMTGETGPEHQKLFQVEVRLGERILGQGEGSNKKKAQQRAAKNALENLDL